jgi:hypothetical protein
MSDELDRSVFEGDLYFNGVNGMTGEYGLKPMSSEKLARLIQGKAGLEELQELMAGRRPPAALTDEEKGREAEADKVGLGELKHKTVEPYPLREGVDAAQLDQTGWAVVFPAKMEDKRREAIKEALRPLLDLRREQAGDDFFRIFEGGAGYRPGERKDEFCKRQQPEIKEVPPNPAEMPYYVLLVGSPEEIPYKFQFQLDVMRGVGRIDLGDDLGAYARYAQAVVMAERGQVQLDRRAAFFGVATPGDKATQLSSTWLVQPVFENLQKVKMDRPWTLESFVGEGQATKAQLGRLLGGDPAQTPALLFTASHGMEFPLGHPRQFKYQGALLCQDWAGPGGGIKRDDYFAGEDLTSDANVAGMMAMFFACYGAGTPKLDEFAKQSFKARAEIAPQAFIGALPARLLSQGALALIGHVERAWGYSFVSPGNNRDIDHFVGALRKLMRGDRVGWATDDTFNLRYAERSSDLSTILEELDFDPDYISDYDLAHKWTSNNDARNYVVVGDPAARLPLGDAAEGEPVRPTIEVSRAAQKPKPTPAEAEAEPSPAEAMGATEGEAELLSPEEAEPAEQESLAPASVAFRAIGPQTYTMSGTVTLLPVGTPGEQAQAFALPEGAPALAEIPSFGILDREGVAEMRDKLTGAVQDFVERMSHAVEKAVSDVTILDVLTYTSEDMATVQKDKLQETAALRAITRVMPDGDIEMCVPASEGKIDKELWALHTDMVQQAQSNRVQLMRTVLEAIGGLLKVV